jgi:hypothetical protein
MVRFALEEEWKLRWVYNHLRGLAAVSYGTRHHDIMQHRNACTCIGRSDKSDKRLHSIGMGFQVVEELQVLRMRCLEATDTVLESGCCRPRLEAPRHQRGNPYFVAEPYHNRYLIIRPRLCQTSSKQASVSHISPHWAEAQDSGPWPLAGEGPSALSMRLAPSADVETVTEDAEG